MIKKTLLACTVIMTIVSLTGCNMFKKERKITGTKGEVVSVINGNTLKMQNGLTVELLGVKPSDLGKKYMEEHIKGKNITLIADKQDSRQTYKTASTKEALYNAMAEYPGTILIVTHEKDINKKIKSREIHFS